MKIATSYFYQIRHFKKNMIPVSTALWDPKWFYHDRIGEPRVFKDKNGIYNGLRIEDLNPGLISGDCHGPANCQYSPDSCRFISSYKRKLDSLDFNEIYYRLQRIANRIQKAEGFKEEPIIVLMVYEKPDVKCSERESLQNFFKKHGVECEELVYPIGG